MHAVASRSILRYSANADTTLPELRLSVLIEGRPLRQTSFTTDEQSFPVSPCCSRRAPEIAALLPPAALAQVRCIYQSGKPRGFCRYQRPSSVLTLRAVCLRGFGRNWTSSRCFHGERSVEDGSWFEIQVLSFRDSSLPSRGSCTALSRSYTTAVLYAKLEAQTRRLLCIPGGRWNGMSVWKYASILFVLPRMPLSTLSNTPLPQWKAKFVTNETGSSALTGSYHGAQSTFDGIVREADHVPRRGRRR